jgi:RNase adapter protein RapZ
LNQQADVRQMMRHIQEFLTHWLPTLTQDHRSYVTVAIGCTGGQHRSVYLVEQLANAFAKNWSTLKRHREIDGNVFASSVF